MQQKIFGDNLLTISEDALTLFEAMNSSSKKFVEYFVHEKLFRVLKRKTIKMEI